MLALEKVITDAAVNMNLIHKDILTSLVIHATLKHAHLINLKRR